ncbi:hypothetical protein HPB50_029627 [Hyalomma asiaticum]|nr:hypothetical protein HPB50_029627 [Hyalomma asiaticum]
MRAAAIAAVLSGLDTRLPFGRMGIVFSREELVKAQQNDPFCLVLSEGLREAERRDAAGYAADADGGPEPACVAECKQGVNHLTFLNFGRELENPLTNVIRCRLEDEETPADCSA